MEKGSTEEQTGEQAERAAVCRAIAGEFALPEADFAGDVFPAADWPGKAEEGAVVLVKTGTALPAGGAEEAGEAWMRVNDLLEEQGVGLYCEVKGDAVVVFYRYY